MKIKINKELFEEDTRQQTKYSKEELFVKRLVKKSYCKFVTFVVHILEKDDYIQPYMCSEKFGWTPNWSTKKLNELVDYCLLSCNPTEGNTGNTYSAIVDNKDFRKIYKYYGKCMSKLGYAGYEPERDTYVKESKEMNKK